MIDFLFFDEVGHTFEKNVFMKKLKVEIFLSLQFTWMLRRSDKIYSFSVKLLTLLDLCLHPFTPKYHALSLQRNISASPRKCRISCLWLEFYRFTSSKQNWSKMLTPLLRIVKISLFEQYRIHFCIMISEKEIDYIKSIILFKLSEISMN